jgi:hypothetical protein
MSEKTQSYGTSQSTGDQSQSKSQGSSKQRSGQSNWTSTSGEQELVAVIGSAAQQASGAMPSTMTPPSGALLRFSAPGADITFFSPEAEKSAQQMAKDIGGQVHRGQASGPLSNQLSQSGSQSGSSTQSGNNPNPSA